MGSTSPEGLGLDLKLCAEKAVDGLLPGGEAMASKLEETLKGLEEERAKIEAFKRELPFSICVVAHVIEIMKEQLERCRSGGENVVEEFMPMKNKFEDDGGVKSEKDRRDKMNWMSSAQLWSDNYSGNSDNNDNKIKKKEESENPALESKRRSGGAFVPFKGLSKEEKPAVLLPNLSLLSNGITSSRSIPPDDRIGSNSKVIGRSPLNSLAAEENLSLHQQATRKARRCWSAELHRRFVLALQQLGGAQVATPKQIRELMKVEGLTNDEVKSHLQKYRLHTRRVPSSTSPVSRPVVVVGGLWVPQDHYKAPQQCSSESGSPEGPLQLAGSAGAVSLTAGDSCEEDAKSESYSWK